MSKFKEGDEVWWWFCREAQGVFLELSDLQVESDYFVNDDHPEYYKLKDSFMTKSNKLLFKSRNEAIISMIDYLKSLINQECDRLDEPAL